MRPFSIVELVGGPAALVLVGALISGLGAYWAARQSSAKNREIVELSKKNAALSAEIAEMNKEALASITGGDSYLYTSFIIGDGLANRCLVAFANDGRFPLYDVAVRVVDISALPVATESGTISYREAMRGSTTFAVGNLGPKQSTIREWKLPAGVDSQEYNVFVTARNGFTTQQVSFRRVSGRWTFATKVSREVGGKLVVLYENVLKDFPRDAEGRPVVTWK